MTASGCCYALVQLPRPLCINTLYLGIVSFLLPLSSPRTFLSFPFSAFPSAATFMRCIQTHSSGPGQQRCYVARACGEMNACAPPSLNYTQPGRGISGGRLRKGVTQAGPGENDVQGLEEQARGGRWELVKW